jgi:hypothetical protein
LFSPCRVPALEYTQQSQKIQRVRVRKIDNENTFKKLDALEKNTNHVSDKFSGEPEEKFVTGRFVVEHKASCCGHVINGVARWGHQAGKTLCSFARSTTFPGKNKLLRIADHAIKPYIPRIWRNFLDCLTLKRDADKFRVYPVLAISQKRKAAVKIAAAHTDAVVVFIERNSRRNNNVKFLRRD